MKTFTALPVGQGDAFLLERDSRAVLVDGGRARHGFESTFSAYSEIDHLSVIVCTHADADHADGLIGLLESNAIRVDEVWLPGRWTERLADLCKDPMGFVYNAVCQADDSQIDDLQAFGQKLSADPVSRDAPSSREDVLRDPAPDVIEALELPIRWPTVPFWWWGRAADSVFAQILEVAQRIQLVAKAAHNAGARLRWFDFDLAQRTGVASGGEPGMLIPVNAAELTAPYAATHLRELEWLALSVANRESLVFIAPESADEPGVLFTGDSDLDFRPSLGPAPQRSVLVTAPHHGSESNAAAYERLSDWGGSQILIRSDGNYKSRPGNSYLSHGQRRFCTLCRGQVGKRAVILKNEFGVWTPDGQSECQCSR